MRVGPTSDRTHPDSTSSLRVPTYTFDGRSSGRMTLPGPSRVRLAAARTGAAWLGKPIYHELAPVVLRYLRASGAREPEDLLGEVFVQVVRNLAAFSGGASDMRAWVMTIAHSRLVDEWRRTRRRPCELLPDEALALIGGTGDLEAEVMQRLSDHRVAGHRRSLVPGTA